MERLKEIRMTLIVLIVGLFFISGCIFQDKYVITFKTNGGTNIKSMSIKGGEKLSEPKEPTKDGYVFDGWYVDNEPYDFRDKVEKNLTLVAKWKKKTAKDNELETTTTTVTTTSTTSSTTKKGETTKKASGTSTSNSNTKKTVKKTTKKTTTKVITTEPVIEYEINIPSNNIPFTPLPGNTNSTNNSGSSSSLTPSNPTPSNPTPSNPTPSNPTPNNPLPDNPMPDNPITPTISIKYLKIEQEIIPDNPTTDNLDESKQYYKMSITTEQSNVESELTETDYNKLMNSNISNWRVETYLVTLTNSSSEEEYLKLEYVDDFKKTLIINYDDLYVMLDYNEQTSKWNLYYPSAKIGLENKYYKNIVDALKYVNANGNIEILKNHNINESIIIDRPVTINAQNHSINSSASKLIEIKNINNSETNIYINSLKLNCISENTENYFVYLYENASINKIIFSDSIINYKGNKTNNNDDILEIDEDKLIPYIDIESQTNNEGE